MQANPPVGKDNPPDLAALVPSDSVVLPDSTEKASSLQGPAKDQVVSDKKSMEVAGTFGQDMILLLNHVLEQIKIETAYVVYIFSTSTIYNPICIQGGKPCSY